MGSPGSTIKIKKLLNLLGPFFGLLFVIGLFCLSSEVRPYFLTGANFKIILTQTVIVAIGALGMTMIIVSGGIDLSVGSVVALASVVGATLLVKGYRDSSVFSPDDIRDIPRLVSNLRTGTNPVSRFLWDQLPAERKQLLADAGSTPAQKTSALIEALNRLVRGPSLYETQRFGGVALSKETRKLAELNPQEAGLMRLNRLLLEDAYPMELAKNRFSLMRVLALTVLVGCGIGMLNGLAIAGLRMMPFIVTLGMMGIARGTSKWLAGNQTVNAPESPVNNIMALVEPLELFPLPSGVWIAVALAAFMGVVMRQTVFGRYVFAIGSNESTARLCGIRVRLYKVVIYAFAGLFFGLAGLMQLSRLTQGDPTVAIGLELDIIAAVVIGGASLNGGAGSILGSMIGALIMAVLRNGSNQMGWPTFMQEIIIGIVIILAVGLDRLRQSRTTT